MFNLIPTLVHSMFVFSCIQGKLIEVNEELLVNPNLLSKTVST